MYGAAQNFERIAKRRRAILRAALGKGVIYLPRFYRRGVSILLCAVIFTVCAPSPRAAEDDTIRWVDFNAPCGALKKAIALDIASHGEETSVKLNYIELLAYLASKNGNDFRRYRDAQLDELAERLRAGRTMEELTEKLKYYPYYLEAYSAALSGLVGAYEIERPDESGDGKHWERRYGVRAFSPIAKSFPYSHYDDFGSSRTYGFSRPHLGNDLLGQVGTPIVAVEGGVVEALGWNQYGGWRIGVRSRDARRYYYYAHLRKGFPYRKNLAVGSVVQAGDVLGYLGRTGYSRSEDVNNIKTAHLHFGLQLIFDESQKECDSEIWINAYELVRLLDAYRSEVRKDPETKDYYRIYNIREITDVQEEKMENKKTKQPTGGETPNVVTESELTGLIPTPPATLLEAESFAALANGVPVAAPDGEKKALDRGKLL
jgi:murein DD-endopeptidase MepM/ murein hydrolase activator NlpD